MPLCPCYITRMSPNLRSRHVRNSPASQVKVTLKLFPTKLAQWHCWSGLRHSRMPASGTKQLCLVRRISSTKRAEVALLVEMFVFAAAQVCFPLPLPNQAGPVALLVRNPQTNSDPNQAGQVALLVGTCVFLASLLYRQRKASECFIVEPPNQAGQEALLVGVSNQTGPGGTVGLKVVLSENLDLILSNCQERLPSFFFLGCQA